MACRILVLQKITKKMAREYGSSILIYKRATMVITEMRKHPKMYFNNV